MIQLKQFKQPLHNHVNRGMDMDNRVQLDALYSAFTRAEVRWESLRRGQHIFLHSKASLKPMGI
jgi:hypothetical protein